LFHDSEAGWDNPEPNARWTKVEARLYLDMTDSSSELAIDPTNHHPFMQPVEITYGSATLDTKFNPGERKKIVIGADKKASQIIIRTRVYCPASDYTPKAQDSRFIGIFVHAIEYR
jgi:hypothetical protein